MSLLLAVAALAELPQARLDRISALVRDANPELCRKHNCPAPVTWKTNRCGFTDGESVVIDPGCQSKLTDAQLAFVIAHEWGHVMGAWDEAGADWIGHAMTIRAGFDGPEAARVFDHRRGSLDALSAHGSASARTRRLLP